MPKPRRRRFVLTDARTRAGLEAVDRVARRYTGHHHLHQIADLKSYLALRLVELSRAYDPGHSVPWPNFLEARLKYAVLDFSRKQPGVSRHYMDKVKRGRLAEADLPARALRWELSVDEAATNWREEGPFEARARSRLAVAMQTEATQEDEAHMAGMRDHLIDAMDTLPERQREVLQLYYIRDMDLKGVGKQYGFTESRACQILAEAHRQIREYFMRQGLIGG